MQYLNKINGKKSLILASLLIIMLVIFLTSQKSIYTIHVEKIDDFELPNGFGERKIIVIRKIKNTPNKYPRPKNLPKLKPIV